MQRDAKNCGLCGHQCGTDPYSLAPCNLGTCANANYWNKPFVSLVGSGPLALAVDESFLYWADSSGGTIGRASTAGGAPATIASGQAKPLHIAVDANTLYWVNQLGAAVMEMPKAGGSPSLLAAAAEPSALAIDAMSVYWANGTDQSVMSIPKSGGLPKVLGIVPGTPSTLVVDADYVYVASLPSAGPASVLSRIPKLGGLVETIGAGRFGLDPFIDSVDVDGANVYWVTDDGMSGSVWKLSKATGTTSRVDYTPYPSHDGIASDGCILYYRGMGTPTLVRAPLSGTSTVGIGVAGPSLVLDSLYAYVTDSGTYGGIYRSLR
jgi:hypothetical protein